MFRGFACRCAAPLRRAPGLTRIEEQVRPPDMVPQILNRRPVTPDATLVELPQHANYRNVEEHRIGEATEHVYLQQNAFQPNHWAQNPYRFQEEH